jgi:hypothetical protein
VLVGMPRSYPPSQTTLVVLETPALRPRARIVLRGYFGVDAISPSGRWLYLVHYRSPSNPLDYEVRAYDLANDRLLPTPVVDPREPDEKMTGVAITRTMSADGRWAYTLYLRPGKAPFIHALDTEARAAYCVDLPTVAESDVSSAKLVLSAPTALSVELGGIPVAVMNTRTLAVHGPGSSPAPVHRRPAAAARHPGGALWLLGIAGLVGLLVLVLRVRARRRSVMAHPPVVGS